MSTIKAVLAASIILTTASTIIIGLLTESAAGWSITAIGVGLFILELSGCLSCVVKKRRLAAVLWTRPDLGQ